MVFLSPSSGRKIQSRTDSRMVAISSSGPCKSEDDSKNIPFFPGRAGAPSDETDVKDVMVSKKDGMR